MRSLLATTLVLLGMAAAGRAGDLRNFDDAPLHAVQFIDEREGWAVGDEGAVFHSVDGGTSWDRQPTGSRASLRSVHFLNPFTGWIVGREELPFRRGSTGLILLTRDGGVTWERVSQNTLPGLERIQFVDARNGFVVGDGSEEYPTGIFRTNDGGAHWTPLPGPRRPLWLAADFTDSQNGALVGAWGLLAVLRHDSLVAAEMDTLGGRTVRSIKVVGERAVAVGDGGLVLLSKDSAGARYRYANLKLPAEVRACLDFRTVCCQEDDIWVAGRPGTVVLHSADRGETWEIQSTGEPLPLNSISFVNKKRGWAVGELGSILGTVDGGKTWKVLQRGGQRAALLAVSARGERLPCDTLAEIGADAGYLIAALQLVSAAPDSADGKRATDPQRLSAATRQSGGAAAETAWQFPLPQHLAQAKPQEILHYWNELHGDRASEELLRCLVLTLRIWRPNVVISDAPNETAESRPIDELVTQVLQEAVNRAADAASFPEQLQVLGLLPWKVGKLYNRWNVPKGSNVSLDLSRISQRLETTIRDFAGESATILSAAPPAFPPVQYFHLAVSSLDGAAAHLNLMQGFDLAPGGTARRRQTLLPLSDPELDRVVRARRNLERLAEAPPSPLNDPNKLLGQIEPILVSMPEKQAVPAAFTIAQQLAKKGQWSLAREAFIALVKRYPAHPLAAESCRWLIRHDASSEARRRYELNQYWVLTQSTLTEGDAFKLPEIHRIEKIKTDWDDLKDQKKREKDAEKNLPPKVDTVKSEVGHMPQGQHLIQTGNFAAREATRQWYRGSVDTAEKLAAFGPIFANEIEGQFCLQASKRQLGNFDEPIRWYTHYLNSHPNGAYHDAAAMELWLQNQRGLPPKPLAYCRQTETRPFLDGDLQDPCWQGGKRLVLKNAQGNTAEEYPTEVALAYDLDFLYFAVQCKHPATGYVPVVKSRSPDADVRAYDRIGFMIDLDRDYSTYYHLQIDQRGCLADECVVNAPDKSWNPRWFVSCKSDQTGYQLEGAIPLAELTGEQITLNRSWAFNVVRILPGRGVQAWSVPADVEPKPEGMGVLVFTQDQQNRPPNPKRPEAEMKKAP
jgi:photosystem II stability/assembly factor-like uncharacterized protein